MRRLVRPFPNVYQQRHFASWGAAAVARSSSMPFVAPLSLRVHAANVRLTNPPILLCLEGLSSVNSQKRFAHSSSTPSPAAAATEGGAKAVNENASNEVVPPPQEASTASSSNATASSEAERCDAPPNPPKEKLGLFQRLKAMFKGMTFKQIVKQYGIPIAIFYWIFNEVMVLAVTYLLHYNYISQRGVVDLIDHLGFGSWVDTKILHTHSIKLGPFQISALLLTNFLVASAFLALFVPVKLPFCIWLYPKLRNSFRKTFPKKVKKGAVTTAPATATTTTTTAAPASGSPFSTMTTAAAAGVQTP